MQNEWAKFWAVDLHVHTPGSSDARLDDYGTPEDIVRAALDATLDAIAITDHNSAGWCARMTAAASGTNLVVLPGIELSTPDGHLLGVWEEGTEPTILEDVLVRVGIKRAQFGDLDIITSLDMSKCAQEIERHGGIAIAAHIDKERGILRQPVRTYVNSLLVDPSIAALEYVLDQTPDAVKAKLQGQTMPAMTQGSDTFEPSISRHSLSGIGKRRTWIKASRPDLCGIRYALEDPLLRVRLADPYLNDLHPVIESLSISGGFLKDLDLKISPDLNCLLGGTGTGKSLVLEALRFVLDQQVDQTVFPVIRDEVNRRLELALREGTVARVAIHDGVERYRISRTYSAGVATPVVEREVGETWVEVDRAPSELITLNAYSQGEVLEYARQPVGRVGLVDAHIGLTSVNQSIEQYKHQLRENGAKLIAARKLVSDLEEKSSRTEELTTRKNELSEFFDDDLVKVQDDWGSERGSIEALLAEIKSSVFARPKIPEAPVAKISPGHDPMFERVRLAIEAYRAAIDAAATSISHSHTALLEAGNRAQGELAAEFQKVSAELDEKLEDAGQESLQKLRTELQSVQANLGVAEGALTRLDREARPELDALISEREELLAGLKTARDNRRTQRRRAVDDLNQNTAGTVKLDIPNSGEVADVRAKLELLKVGSHVRDTSLNAIASKMHPLSLGRLLWSGEVDPEKLPAGVNATDITRLHANIADRDLWSELLELQILDTPDRLGVKFRKPEGGAYVSIEDLSHGQKCTAILVILLAQGRSPVLIDQPEDALHAPWIEDYLVERLRALRGSRQYLFATRSPGMVVSADSELLITMRATSESGSIEAAGSLERFDLNKLALHHLEGGKTPFGRRTLKLRSSLGSD